jgi:OOP family OmpA-OmpF porin
MEIKRHFVRGIFSILLLGAISNVSVAQNLVPNPSFEVHTGCPTGFSEITLATPWFQATAGTCDYFNSCNQFGTGVPVNAFGTEAALGGDAYAGVIGYIDGLGFREYLEVKLLSPLDPGVTYFVSFYVSLAEDAGWNIDSIGAYFQAGPVNASVEDLLLTPQVASPTGTQLDNTSGWTLVTGSFVAVGGEDHMVIGNFLSDLATNQVSLGTNDRRAYYYVDQVSVDTVVAVPAMTPLSMAVLALAMLVVGSLVFQRRPLVRPEN